MDYTEVTKSSLEWEELLYMVGLAHSSFRMSIHLYIPYASDQAVALVIHSTCLRPSHCFGNTQHMPATKPLLW